MGENLASNCSSTELIPKTYKKTPKSKKDDTNLEGRLAHVRKYHIETQYFIKSIGNINIYLLKQSMSTSKDKLTLMLMLGKIIILGGEELVVTLQLSCQLLRRGNFF